MAGEDDRVLMLLVLTSPCPSFSGVPNSGEADLRPLYCAFAISSMLDDWSGVDVDGALRFIRSCEVRETTYQM